jgi:hypothetical protein
MNTGGNNVKCSMKIGPMCILLFVSRQLTNMVRMRNFAMKSHSIKVGLDIRYLNNKISPSDACVGLQSAQKGSTVYKSCKELVFKSTSPQHSRKKKLFMTVSCCNLEILRTGLPSLLNTRALLELQPRTLLLSCYRPHCVALINRRHAKDRQALTVYWT